MRVSYLLAAILIDCTLAFSVKPRAPVKSAADQRQTCTVYALGGKQDDIPQIVKAFEECGNGGRVVFPENQTYWINSKLNPVVNDVVIEWRGLWQYSDDIQAWGNNSYHIEFQNHWAGFVMTGDGIHIDGYGTGGIHGNGEVWYNADQGITQPGRPMPIVFWNVSQVTVSNFSIIQPQLWSLKIMNGTNMAFENIYCNATATQAPYGRNWVQNTDGFDTMDAHNIWLENFVYQGGDDCIALKPRSCNIYVRNATCRGGNGMAVGSLGQYLEDSSVENVVVDDVKIETYNADMENGAYIKTWVGELVPQPAGQGSYESAGLPRGGGWGQVRNILFSNFNISGANRAASISQDSGNNGSFAGTSNMLVSNVAFVNFTGYLNSTGQASPKTVSVSCSGRHPCYNIDFSGFDVALSHGTQVILNTTCANVTTNGIHGVSC